MTIRTTLLASTAALLLSAGAAAAAPATAQSNVNVRSGPGTQYPVVGSLRGGETVDVADCTGSWCQVSFSGGTGYASQNYLAMAGGGGPGYAAAAPGYVDPGYVDPGYVDDAPGYAYNYDDYYYDDYGPSFGFVVGPRFRHHRYGRWDGGHQGQWQGRPGWNGGNRVGAVGAPGRVGSIGPGFNRAGVGAPGRIGAGGGFNRGGGSPQMSAPTGMRVGGVGGGGGRIGVGGGGGGGGGRMGIGGGGGGRIGGGGGGGGRGGVGGR